MLLLLNIKSINNLNLIFEFIGQKRKYNLFKYNKVSQKKFKMSIYDYKKLYFTKGIPEITENNLLDYYAYLKRKYIKKNSFEDIKDYYVEFFCKFIDEHNINFELDSSHELSIDILSSIYLKRINLLLNLYNYKSSYKTEKINDQNKKSFLYLFQTIFGNKNITKISEIKIISENEKGEYIKNNSYDLIIKMLIENIYNLNPKIKTGILYLYDAIYRKISDDKNDEKIYFKNWKLIIPYEKFLWFFQDDIKKNISFDIDMNQPFERLNIFFIKENNIKNYFLKLNYEDIWLLNEDLKNVKKLELKLNYEIIDDFENFDKVYDAMENNEDYRGNKRRGWGRGRRGRRGDNRLERIEEIKNNFNRNNIEYIKYFNNLLKLETIDEESHLKLLNLLEKTNFDYLNILNLDISPIKNYQNQFSINKLTNSIKIYLINYKSNETKFLNRLKEYDTVELQIEYSEDTSNSNNKIFYLFKFDKDSKVKNFKLLTIYIQTGKSGGPVLFPINFENLISLDLTYTVFLNHYFLSFPLTENKCEYIFKNLKILKLDFCYDCEECMGTSPKDLIQNLSNNFKYCPVLENLSIIYEKFDANLNEIKLILDGIKLLKHLKSLYLDSKTKENGIIKEDEFYKAYPEYVNYCPFLNDIEIKINFLYIKDIFCEKNIDYKLDDVIINDYKYISTLGQKDLYSTYLCKNKENKKVVIRKFKKSRVNNSKDLFQNEKYCLMKFRNNPNVINYIEFLTDEHFEYIVYEFIENAIKHFKSKYLGNKIYNFIENCFKFHGIKDKNIILLPIYKSNILIKKNFDIILTGFGYLNIYENEFKENLENFYDFIDKICKEKILSYNSSFKSHIYDYYSMNMIIINMMY